MNIINGTIHVFTSIRIQPFSIMHKGSGDMTKFMFNGADNCIIGTE